MARPREFKPEDALDRIQKTFWMRGYDGTSMQDLEKATGLKKQSLYREFGNKDAMYSRALLLYRDRDIARLAEVLSAGDAAETRFRELFDAVLEPVRKGDRSGCFLCNSAIEHAGKDDDTLAFTREGIGKTEALFAQALQISEPYKSDVGLRRDKAVLLTSGYFGLRVMIRGGTPLPQLKEVVHVLVKDI